MKTLRIRMVCALASLALLSGCVSDDESASNEATGGSANASATGGAGGDPSTGGGAGSGAAGGASGGGGSSGSSGSGGWDPGPAPACDAAPPSYDGAHDGVYDFSFGLKGPQRVVQGHDLWVELRSELPPDAKQEYAYYSTTGLPSGASASYPALDEGCCGGNRAWMPGNTLLRIETGTTTPPGIYPILIGIESGGVTRELCHLLYVEPPPDPLPKQPVASPPPVPELATWESQMKSFGKKHCNLQSIQEAGIWEGGVWYYDGIRVFQQITDYTGDSSFEPCAGYVEASYRPYVLGANGGVPGWRVFPHGLAEDWVRTGDAVSRDAAIALSKSSAYAGHGGGVDPGLVRETAYLVNAYRIAQKLGEPEHPRYRRAVDFLLGHVDQWFVSKTEPYMQPFMVGLLSEALIDHYEQTQDPRVPPAIRTAMDGIWEWAWVPSSNAFFYESTGDTSTGTSDLNPLIAPAFAWLYRQTGDPTWQERADQIFVGGLTAWLDGGKQFSQSYRWSFQYVKWRQNP
jgi:hypothetical protein